MKNNKTLLFTALLMKGLTLALFFVFNINGNAQTTLNVWLNNGGVENYAFTDNLSMKASSETELTLTSGTVEVIYTIADIRKLTINSKEAEEIVASINTAEAQTSDNSETAIYDMSGKQITTLKKDAKNVTQVDLKGLPVGIYIVKSKQTQFKIIIK
jgi:hypothetical protein